MQKLKQIRFEKLKHSLMNMNYTDAYYITELK